jgi:GntR family transcriptional regulator of abcA and norABC
MSYKLDLSDIDREGEESITAQIAGRIRSAIESGSLAPGDKLPSTRALAEQAGVNHLTAVRVYRRLAEEGYVMSGVGRGTFVRSVPPPAAADDAGVWQHAVLPEQQRSYVDEVFAETMHLSRGTPTGWIGSPPDESEMLDMSVAWTAPQLHPADQLRVLADELFETQGGPMLGYTQPEGVPELLTELARRGEISGFARSPEELVVTSGARQGIDLVARTILRPGDVVVCESPTFIGTLSSLQATGARVLGVPFDRGGIDVEAFERILGRHEVKLLALQTGSQNPTGQDLAPDRAARLVELAQERSFFILEDGVYATVRFAGAPPPPRLRQSAPDHVIYVDSLSKTIGGGLRIGWVAASGEAKRRIAELKLGSDVHSSTLTQYLAARWLQTGGHDKHVKRVNPIYAKRGQALVESVNRRLGDDVSVLEPNGGHNLWLTFRRPIDERMLFAEALRNRVGFTPGRALRPEPSSQSSLRLSFPLLDEERLDEAVRRLAVAIRAVRRQSPASGWSAALS